MNVDLTRELGAIVDTLNEFLGHPICAEACSHGGSCSLPTDHEGNHEAIGSSGKALCEWSNPGRG
jgi:hypothetical protein